MNFTETGISKMKAKKMRYDTPDDKIPSLYLRIEPSGVKTWYVYYRHPVTHCRVRKKIAPQEQLTVAQAREYAKNFVATVILTKEDPVQAEKKMRSRLTLEEVVNKYIPWMKLHRKSIRQSVTMLKSFEPLFPTIAEDLSPADITRWKQTLTLLKPEISPKTINRRVALLKGMLSWAVREGHINTNPLRGTVEMLKEGDNGRVRYLTPEEREKLLQALEKRDSEEKDYLRCAVLLSLNSGIRKGTLLKLRWEYVDWNNKTLTLPAQIMKGGKTKIVPLNPIALEALIDWRNRSAPQAAEGYVFPGDTRDGHLGDVKNPWKTLLKRAGIGGFRWHDMRHDFGSQLAMQGVDILVIKELMCHESLKMTLVYSHLAPQHLEKAVAKLSSLYS
ncbi:site-specific integrase [Aminobacterium sp. EBM-42]|uniref:site-specific integrase n=1 Tax=Aminobacterium sp. EBM-42 TaxID=1918503 RepID=UPI00257B2380|nr:site-specific integrase [Aminobacterium sp. EBM-42]